jgi:rubredoxin
MWKSDIICPECGAGYRRIVLTSCKGAKGEYRCLTCNYVLEVFDGLFEVLIRLTVPPKRPKTPRDANKPKNPASTGKR